MLMPASPPDHLTLYDTDPEPYSERKLASRSDGDVSTERHLLPTCLSKYRVAETDSMLPNAKALGACSSRE